MTRKFPLIKLIGRVNKMPDFEDVEWGGYKIRLRANDPTRRDLSRHGLTGLLPYFSAMNICLDIGFKLPKPKNIKDVKNIIRYKWFLCSENGKRIEIEANNFNIFNTQGQGVFTFAGAKQFKK